MKHAMPRPRSARNRGLPPNLYWEAAAGLYRYRHPRTGKRTYLSCNRAECIDAANQLNAMLIQADADLVERVVHGSGNHSFANALKRYRKDIFAELELRPKTRSQYAAYLRKLDTTALAGMQTPDISVHDVAETLDALTAGRRMRNIYRAQLVQVFRYTVELGWRDDNPALVTRVVAEKRQRMRLTMEGYTAVRTVAPAWLQVAMDIALCTLQRREDIVALRYTDIRDGALHVKQQKTGKKLRITIGPELAARLDASRDGRACPYIIHHLPRRVPRRERRAKNRHHPMQVFPDKLTAAFRDARDASQYYADAKEPPPTLHEIRSLGADRYRELGWPEVEIQHLLGHADIAMTRAYLDGHEPPWEDVRCG